MIRKVLLLLSFAFIIAFSSYSQNGKIVGKIYSGGEPLPYCSVILDGTSRGTSTDSLGRFTIDKIDTGNYVLKAQMIGYDELKKNVKVSAGKVCVVKMEMNETAIETEEVVITGTMKEVSKSDSPIPVEVYTQAYFKKNPTPNLFESLQIVNGIQPQLNCNVCNTGDIHINGMEGPYTMVTIDGMPIISSLSTVYGLSGIPNSIVQRIEVVKGPASTLYGSEAVGGLVNVITKSPGSAPIFSADIFGTSHQEYNVDLSYKKNIRKASTLLGVNYYNFNNKRDVNDDNFTDVTLQNRISIFNKWTFERKNNRTASIAGRYLYEDRWGGELQWDKKFRGGDSVYGESIFTKRYELIGTYQLPVKEKIMLQYSWNHHHQNSAYGKVSYIASQAVTFAQLLWDKKIGSKNDLLVGLPFRYTYYDDNTSSTEKRDINGLINTPQKIFLPGIFVQDEIAISKKLTSLAGIRYDYNSDHGNILSPRLSFKYVLDDKNTFRLSSGNGYRVVNLFTEDHAALTGSRQVEILEDLKPERSWNANFNYQRFFMFKSGFANLDASLFYTYFTNKIVGDFLSDPNKIIYENLKGYAVSRGLTINGDVSFKSSLKIIGGVTFMNVFSMREDAIGNLNKVIQMHAPGFSGTFAITYKFKKNFSIDYTGRVTGPMELPVVANDFRPSKSPWFTIQNIQITKSLKHGIQVYGGIKNLFNFIPKDPLLRPFDPFDKNIGVNNPNGYTFDTTYNYAPVQGIRGFLGVRWIVG